MLQLASNCWVGKVFQRSFITGLRLQLGLEDMCSSSPNGDLRSSDRFLNAMVAGNVETA